MNRQQTPYLFIIIFLVIVPLSLIASDRIALVIGVNDYPEDSVLDDLNNAVLDAGLISKTLKSVGFEVIQLSDPNWSEMDAGLYEFERRIEKGGTALVYFSGHGIEFEGKNYLLASNARLKARSRLGEEALRAETFATTMVLSGAKSSLLFLDCCREAPSDSKWATKGSHRKFGLGEIDIQGDIIISLAAAPGKPALEPSEPGKNGPYALALAKWIPTGHNHMNLFQNIRQDVHMMTEGLQRTWENGSFLETFYFVKGGPTKPFADDVKEITDYVSMRTEIDRLKEMVAIPVAKPQSETTGKSLEKQNQALSNLNQVINNPARKTNRSCTIVILLPREPHDIYIEGMHIITGAKESVVVQTPELPVGSFKYALVVKNARDSSKFRQRVITGIHAGANLTVDMRENADVGSNQIFTNSLGMNFVKVPGTGVWFCEHETRVKDYATYAAVNQGVDMSWKDYEYEGHRQTPDHPVVNVSWDDARAFCSWLSEKEGKLYRLPTDHEWSVAVGIGDQEDRSKSPIDKSRIIAAYPWGREWPPPKDAANLGGDESAFSYRKINNYSDHHPFTGPVKRYSAGKNGLFDLSGNVWEWCEDWYSREQTNRVLRGGSWFNFSEFVLRSSYRLYVVPAVRKNDCGFRCVLSMAE